MVRLHLFQGRYLPAADDTGTLDPCVTPPPPPPRHLSAHAHAYTRTRHAPADGSPVRVWGVHVSSRGSYVRAEFGSISKKSGIERKTSYPRWCVPPVRS